MVRAWFRGTQKEDDRGPKNSILAGMIITARTNKAAFPIGKQSLQTYLMLIFSLEHRFRRRKIRLIECNAKCLKMICKGTSRQVFNLSEVPLPFYDPPPPYELYTCILYTIQYSLLIHTGKGRKGEKLTREKVRALEGQ